jgi:prevent-host-death family protein
MRSIELSEASRSLAEYASEALDETLVVTNNKKPVAALVPLGDVDRESFALSTSPEFLAIIEAARREFGARRTLTLDAVRQTLADS